MNQAFIEIKDGLPVNTDIMCAAEGFEQLAYRVRTFTKTDILTSKYRLFYNDFPFVGCIDTMKSLFAQREVMPDPIDFPQNADLGRTVERIRLFDVIERFRVTQEPVFIKPVTTKLFDGMILKEEANLNYFPDENVDCFVSRPLDIVAEWRGFVFRNKLVDVRQYSGDFWFKPPFSRITHNVNFLKDMPIAYTIDVAALANTGSVVVEFNDFWAIGSYGLEPKLYAEMLEARFREIMG